MGQLDSTLRFGEWEGRCPLSMWVRYPVVTDMVLQPEGSHKKEKDVSKTEGQRTLGCALRDFYSESWQMTCNRILGGLYYSKERLVAINS